MEKGHESEWMRRVVAGEIQWITSLVHCVRQDPQSGGLSACSIAGTWIRQSTVAQSRSAEFA